MNINVKNGEIRVKDIKCFSLDHTLACGQCFHYYREEDQSFTIISGENYCNVYMDGGDIIFRETTRECVESYWYDYFDLARDYEALEKNLSQIDGYLKEAVVYGSGMRILKQDAYDMVMMFIISANNNIKRITKIIRTLSENYGDLLGTYNDRRLYGFPKAETLMKLSLESLRETGLGYRDKYIKSTAEMLYRGDVVLEALTDASLKEVEKELMKLSGVGKKVADCIALFAYNKIDAFPLDTWVKKIMTQYYGIDYKDKKALENFIDTYFGKVAGFAQQYLFYHIRLEG